MLVSRQFNFNSHFRLFAATRIFFCSYDYNYNRIVLVGTLLFERIMYMHCNLVNFLLAGSTVSWYFRKEHTLSFAINNLFSFHWGSVVAGSFLLYILYPFDLICDFIKPSNPDSTFNFICC